MKAVPAVVHGWPGFEMTTGDISLGLVPSLGGRIMSLKFRGEELFYVPARGRGDLPQLPAHIPDLAAFKRGFGFRIFGGDKTWVAPEWAWLEKAPSLDLDAGVYACEQKDGACVMTSPVCRETGLQVVRRVGLLDDGDIGLVETLRNTTQRSIERSVWNVTQIIKPFDVYLPAEPGAVRSYHAADATLPDPGPVLSRQDGWTVVPCRNDVCYKFGGMGREGRAAVVRETPRGKVVFARVFDIAPDKPYAHNSMVEVFNSSEYAYGELEVHAPLVAIPPGGEASLTQLWRVYAA